MEAISFWLEWLPGIIGRIAVVPGVRRIHTIRRISWRDGHGWGISRPIAMITRVARHRIWRVTLMRGWISSSLLLGSRMPLRRWRRQIDLSLRWRIRRVGGLEEGRIRGIRWKRTRDMLTVGSLG